MPQRDDPVNTQNPAQFDFGLWEPASDFFKPWATAAYIITTDAQGRHTFQPRYESWPEVDGHQNRELLEDGVANAILGFEQSCFVLNCTTEAAFEGVVRHFGEARFWVGCSTLVQAIYEQDGSVRSMKLGNGIDLIVAPQRLVGPLPTGYFDSPPAVLVPGSLYGNEYVKLLGENLKSSSMNIADIQAWGSNNGSQMRVNLVDDGAIADKPPDEQGEGDAEKKKRKPPRRVVLHEQAFSENWQRLHGEHHSFLKNEKRWLLFNHETGLHEDGSASALNSMVDSIDGYVKANTKPGSAERVAQLEKHVGLGRARNALTLAAAKLELSDEEFDRPSTRLPFPDGSLLDLDTGQRRKIRPDDRVRRTMGVSPEKGEPRLFLECLRKWLGAYYEDADVPDLEEYLQNYIGYCLDPDTSEHAFLFLEGLPGSGKSTLLDVVGHVFGKLGAVVAGSKLVNDDAAIHAEWLVRLQNVKLMRVDELPQRGRWDPENLNKLAAGTEIDCRDMHGKSFSYEPHLKMIIAADRRPSVAGSSGFWRRIKLIVFNLQMEEAEQDQELLSKLKAEGGQILTWAIEGHRRWRADGLGTLDAIAREVVEYRADNDQTTQFVEDFMEVHPGNRISSREAFRLYRQWADEQGRNYRLSQNMLGRELRRIRGVSVKKERAGTDYLGISAKPLYGGL